MDRRSFLRRVAGVLAASVALPRLVLAAPRVVRRSFGPTMVPISEIRIDPRYNIRTPDLGSESFRRLASSILENGVRSPLLIDQDSNLRDGFYRIKAARQAGLTHVPCITTDLKSP